jgi:hypothetical protein
MQGVFSFADKGWVRLIEPQEVLIWKGHSERALEMGDLDPLASLKIPGICNAYSMKGWGWRGVFIREQLSHWLLGPKHELRTVQEVVLACGMLLRISSLQEMPSKIFTFYLRPTFPSQRRRKNWLSCLMDSQHRGPVLLTGGAC